MKKYMVLLLIVLLSFLLFGCSKLVIEDTIRKFQDAINNEDAEALKEVMSPDSDFYKTTTFEEFIEDNFSQKIPVEYKNLDIDINDNLADVYADEYSLANTDHPEINEVLFVMRKVDNFFSFIFPEWKVYRFYNEGDFNNPVWKRVKK